MRLIFCFLFLSLGLLAYSQNNLIVKGTVKDQSGNLLPFATIGIANSPYGTVSNMEGEFVFYAPAAYQYDTLSISYLGFQTHKVVLAGLKGNSLDVTLIEEVFVLDEVEVNVEQLSAKQILMKALENLDQNYVKKPFLMKGFFRDIREQDGKVAYLSEAAVEIQDTGFSLASNRPKKIFLKGLRSSESWLNELISPITSGNTLSMNMETNFWLHSLKHRLKREDFTIEDIQSKDERSFYVITTEKLSAKTDLAKEYKQMQYKLKHRYHVDTETYAILKIAHLEIPIEGKYVGIELLEESDSIYQYIKGWKITVELEEYQGKVFLKYQNATYAYDLIDEKENRMVNELSYQLTFVATEIDTDQSKVMQGTRMDSRKALALQGATYDREFWNDPENVKLVPLTQRQIRELEETKPLEEQFRSKKRIKVNRMQLVN